ncbi:cobyric acid synthase [Heliorestis acidaminivorans]|nr:cobyric acid synthase [Heliorestis acidaminivorans]
MLQGTSSNVGKSVLATAFCRIFYQDGLAVVPFKSQNMALNSFITKTGGEMGRAQVVQAEAAGLEPDVAMNPVLLKPTGQSSSQVILMGKAVGNLNARTYHMEYATKALSTIQTCLDQFHRDYDVIVIEGAGSPAEVNLKARDIANMRVAKMAKAPVLLVADIDRGGALASVVGTLALLDPDEQELVQGIIINKFRGDITLLQPAIDFLEEYTKKPVLGVIPYFQGLHIQAEDSVALEKAVSRPMDDKKLDIAVIRLPRISNFTDFDALTLEQAAQIRYITSPDQFGEPDMVILPGTKNTIEDAIWLQESGLIEKIKKHAEQGKMLWGICGGYQLLGREIVDPQAVESNQKRAEGLGFFNMVTQMEAEKVTQQVHGKLCGTGPFLGPLQGMTIEGYEIHMGRSHVAGPYKPFCQLQKESSEEALSIDGIVGEDGLIIGTYLHGIYDNDALRQALLNFLRRKKGWEPLNFAHSLSVKAKQEEDYNRLAEIVRESIDMKKLYEIVGLQDLS